MPDPTKARKYKRRKDFKVENTGGTTRVKPVKSVGEDGRVQVQQIKYADGASHYNRYEDGELVDRNYVPKKMRVKKTRKLRGTKKMKLIKPGKAPAYTAPAVTLDEEDLKEVAKRERGAEYKKNKGKRTRKRIVNNVKDAVKTTGRKIKAKLTPKPGRRKVKNLVTGKTNRVR